MFRVGVGAAALRHTRLGYSALGELTCGVRSRAHPGALATVARRRGRTEGELLAAVVAPGVPMPTALVPGPEREGERLDDELHRLAGLDAGTFLAEVRSLLDHGPEPAQRLRPVSDDLRRFLDRDGLDLPAVLADLLGCYDQLVFRRTWPQVRAGLDRDLEGRADVLLRSGVDGLLGGLSRHVAWDGGQLLLDKPFVEDLGTASGLVLVPSLFVTGAPLVAVDRARLVTIRFGARRPWTGSADPSGALNDLIGTTRAELLTALVAPAHTHELAARHHLSPSTVSHHLQVLRRAGLVRGVREDRRVWYHRSDLGDAVVRGRAAAARPT